jgi:hypothetical protein
MKVTPRRAVEKSLNEKDEFSPILSIVEYRGSVFGLG